MRYEIKFNGESLLKTDDHVVAVASWSESLMKVIQDSEEENISVTEFFDREKEAFVRVTMERGTIP